MMWTRFTLLSVVLGLSGLAGGAAQAKDYDKVAGQVTAANRIAETCKGIGQLGTGDYQSYVMEATELLGQQGYGRQKMRALLFYATTESLDALADSILAERGVTSNDNEALCRFGRSLAGKSDTIGQFLKVGD
jgi:hypothetical protein